MSATWLTTILLSMAGGTLCLGAVTGTMWPGVALAGISILPWAWEAWLGRTSGADAERFERIDAAIREGQDRLRATQASANDAIGVIGTTLREHTEQLNSLRNAASLRGTLGG